MLRKLILGSALFMVTACGAQTSTAVAQNKESAKETKTEQTKAPKQDITTQKIGESMYMLLGPGGNLSLIHI